MRVGRSLPVIRYYRPGDPAMEAEIHEAAKGAKAVLLANHGPVVSGRTLEDAVHAAEVTLPWGLMQRFRVSA